MANRLGELRHEEFSHCCVNESVGRDETEVKEPQNVTNDTF